ncbi:MAG: hypothetical protein KKG13_04915, partial [Nanoarchaeota archaeon]|nr:hypothetical protein [Nanoarchaeota archaeon]
MENNVSNSTENTTSIPNVPYQPLVVKGKSLGEAWENAVRIMMHQGFNRFIKAPEYQTWTKDSPMFIMVDNPAEQPRFSSKAPITQEIADDYSNKMLNGMDKEK